MSDPRDELAAELVLALRNAVVSGVTVTRECGGYRVVSADGELSITVLDDGSTSELYLTGRERIADACPTGRRADCWEAARFRAAALRRDR